MIWVVKSNCSISTSTSCKWGTGWKYFKMNQGLRNLISFTGDTLENLWRVTSLNQAIALGIDDRKGSIKVNKDADLVILDDDMNVKSTIKQGKVHTFS